MRRAQNQSFSYLVGIAISLAGHVLLGVVALFILENRAANAIRPAEVFTVTLEGGEKIGGFSQVPKPDAKPDNKKPKELPDSSEEKVAEESSKKVETSKAEEKVEEKKLEQPSAVEDVVKKAEEQKKIEEAKLKEAKLKAEEEKKKVEEQKEKEREKKKQLEEEKKAQEEKDAEEQKKLEAKREKESRKKAFDSRLNAIRRGITEDYKGESANAGGQGVGAAKLGGTGTGGGTLIAVEKLAYLNALEAHVKRGWHWIMGSTKLSAVVRFQITPNGEVQNVRLEQSSGVTNFDDSVLRAVTKASPVPIPPEKFFAELSDVRIIFDSKQ